MNNPEVSFQAPTASMTKRAREVIDEWCAAHDGKQLPHDACKKLMKAIIRLTQHPLHDDVHRTFFEIYTPAFHDATATDTQLCYSTGMTNESMRDNYIGVLRSLTDKLRAPIALMERQLADMPDIAQIEPRATMPASLPENLGAELKRLVEARLKKGVLAPKEDGGVPAIDEEYEGFLQAFFKAATQHLNPALALITADGALCQRILIWPNAGHGPQGYKLGALMSLSEINEVISGITHRLVSLEQKISGITTVRSRQAQDNAVA